MFSTGTALRVGKLKIRVEKLVGRDAHLTSFLLSLPKVVNCDLKFSPKFSSKVR